MFNQDQCISSVNTSDNEWAPLELPERDENNGL